MAQHAGHGGLSISLLGEFRVAIWERALGEDEWPSRKAKSLVKLLALTPGHRLHRERVMDLLWPDLGTQAGANNFRKVLHFARRALNPSSSIELRLLDMKEDVLSLAGPGFVWVDVEAFEEAAAAAERTGDPSLYHEAIALYRGELLPEDPYEEWTIRRRDELRATYLSLLTGAARHSAERGEVQAAIEALEKAIEVEPALEEAHRGLMRLYATGGQRHQAIRQYQQLREALRRELDAEPDAESEELHREIVAGRVGSTSPVERSVWEISARRHNLHAQLTSFIGREKEMGEVRRLLSGTRLLTLTGPGGSGKTRLALEVAAALVDEYPDGVWWVELGGLSDPELVPQTVASALGVRDQPGRALVDTLSEYLRSKQLLLVLDNCEHLVGACAALAETLLRACQGLRILATSREALNIGGETTWPVPSLSLPAGLEESLGEELAADPARYEAVHLFVERAASAQPGFRLAGRDGASVAQICVRLDGIPLAIELAAARARVLSTEQIAERLDDSFQLLTGGSRTALPRHQTLRAAVDWSYGLLTDKERALFRRLAVFAGGFTLDAVEAVCVAEPVEEYEALDVLSHLVEKSLVMVLDAEAGRGRRYRLLETLRQYGRERLTESGEEGEVLGRHARHYALLCAGAEPQLHGPGQVEWLDRLNAELDNLRAALDWSRRHDPEVGMLLAGSIPRFWDIRGYLTEGRRWLDSLLELAPGRKALQAKALYTSGHLASRQGDLGNGRRLLEESVAIYTELGDQAGLAWALERLGIAISLQGDDDLGLAQGERSIEIFRRIGYKSGLGWALGSQGMNARTVGDYDRALAALNESYVITREVGDLHGIAYALNNLGQLARVAGDYDRSWALLEECLELSRRMRNMPFICWTLECLSTVARMRGDYAGAWNLLKESLQLAREMGIHRHLARCIYSCAVVATHFGQVTEGVKLFAATMSLYPHTRLSLDADEIVELDEALAKTRAGLSDTAFAQAWDEGSAMTWERAGELALSIRPAYVRT